MLGVLDEHLLGSVGGVIGLVPGFDQLPALSVLLGVRLGLFDEVLDLLVGEPGAGGDGDALLLAGGLVLGRHVQDAVGVDVEGDVDLRGAARGGREAVEVEAADGLVLGRHRALALEHVDLDGRLGVGSRGEDLREGGRDGGVALDERRGDAAQRFDAEAQRRHVQQQYVFHLALEDAGLDGGADGHDLVGVDALVGLLAEELLHLVHHGRHACHPADHDDLGDVALGHAGVAQGLLARRDGALDQIGRELLELRARQRHREVLGPRSIRRHEGEVDLRLRDAGELDLRPLGGLLEALEGHAVLAQVDALVALELVGHPLHHALVEIVAAEVRVPVGGLHLEDAVADVQDGDVEGAAAQVIDRDDLVELLVQAVGEGSRRGLVDDAQDLEPGDGAGVLGGLALAVVEVGGDGDDGLRDRLAQLGLGVRLELLEHDGGDLRGGVVPVAHRDGYVSGGAGLDGVPERLHLLLDLGELASDEPLDRIDGVLGVGDRLALGHHAHVALTALGVHRHGRRGRAAALAVLEHERLAGLHHGDGRVRRPKVDTDNLRHISSSGTWSHAPRVRA